MLHKFQDKVLASNPASVSLQLESAAANVLARFHHVEEDGQEQDFTGLQVLLHSSKQFGPTSLRELSVRFPAVAACLCLCRQQRVLGDLKREDK